MDQAWVKQSYVYVSCTERALKFLSPVHIHTRLVVQLHINPVLGVFISKCTWNIESESIPQSNISQESYGWNLDLSCHVSPWLPTWVSATLAEGVRKILQTNISRFHELSTLLHLHILNVSFVVFKYVSSVSPATLWALSIGIWIRSWNVPGLRCSPSDSCLSMRSEAWNFIHGELKTKDNLISFHCCL